MPLIPLGRRPVLLLALPAETFLALESAFLGDFAGADDFAELRAEEAEADDADVALEGDVALRLVARVSVSSLDLGMTEAAAEAVAGAVSLDNLRLVDMLATMNSYKQDLLLSIMHDAANAVRPTP
jgi:hypothetical protein